MRVLLIAANTERINMPSLPLGLALVATAAHQAGHEMTFLDLLSVAHPDQEVRRAIATASPEAIGISVRNIDDQDMQSRCFLLEPVKELMATCRDCTKAPLILGGAGYSIFPEAALAYLGADLGVYGEGEILFPALLVKLQQGADPRELPGIYSAGHCCQTERGIAADLKTLPLPDSRFWVTLDPTTPDLWIPVQTRRGCPLDCSYCSTALIEGRTVRSRRPQTVAEYLRQVAEAGFRRFYFVDNTFHLPLSYTMELCRCLAALKLDISWRCILYPHQVPNELITAMAEAGCVEVSLGFESGSRPVLQAMNKRFEPEEVRQISDALAEHGIRRMGFLLLGGPGETRTSVQESLAFAESLHLDLLKISVGLRIYPQTPLATMALEEGLISPGDDLLFPRFYLRPELKDWIAEVVITQER